MACLHRSLHSPGWRILIGPIAGLAAGCSLNGARFSAQFGTEQSVEKGGQESRTADNSSGFLISVRASLHEFFPASKPSEVSRLRLRNCHLIVGFRLDFGWRQGVLRGEINSETGSAIRTDS